MSDEPKDSGPPPRRPAETRRADLGKAEDERRRRQAEALRANLARRKEQARGRATPAGREK